MDTIPGNDPMPNPPQSPLGGLDPEDLLKQGLADDTFMDGAATSFNPPPIEELAAIFPQFEILELIGQGGMGAVYKVRQKDLDRIVALKILPPVIGQSPEFSNRFTREAKALAKLNHPGIVTLHEFGQQDGLYFILMEFVDGVNLAQLMKTSRISPREALAIVPQICDALQFAHDQGIVHRDIKPENILLDRLGRVKVADFGIAKVVAAVCEEPIRSGDIPVPADQTLVGRIIGTPRYMAPEQISHPSDVDHRADIYALGVVFYQMLTGELPGKSLEAPSKKVHIDVRLDEIVLRAMETEPEMRYQTAREFRTIVDGIQPPANVHPSSFSQQPHKRGMLRRWWWVFLVMFPLGLFIGLAAGSVWAYVAPKKYQAESVIEVGPPSGSTLTIPSTFFADQVEFIKSRKSLAAAAEELELPNRWMLSQESVFQTLQAIVQTEKIHGTDLIRIGVRHTSKQDAASIANSVALNYQRISPGKVVIHEKAFEPTIPVEPNVALVLFAGSLLGVILSPILALIPIAILQRVFPENGLESTAAKIRRPGRTIAIVCGVFGIFLIVPLALAVSIFLLRPIPVQDAAKVKSVNQASQDTLVSEEMANEKIEIGGPEIGVLAEMWLVGIDAGKYSQSWRAAANFFQSANPESRWVSEVGQMRIPLGAVKSREIRQLKKVATLTGAPDGEYFIVQFDSSFAGKENVVEVVRFKLEEEGSWKAAGYFVR